MKKRIDFTLDVILNAFVFIRYQISHLQR